MPHCLVDETNLSNFAPDYAEEAKKAGSELRLQVKTVNTQVKCT